MLLYPKDLTPASLAAIVEGVPVEATPPRMVYKGGVFPSWFDQFSERESAQIATDVAALAFIGSMIGWLAATNELVIDSDKDDVSVRQERYYCFAPTLLQALANACREVSK